MLPGRCPTGRTNARIKGWLGRADQTTKMRGMFVHPAHVADIMRRFRGSAAGTAGRERRDGQRHHDLAGRGASAPQGLGERIGEAIRDVTKLRGDVELLEPGSLPNDGKVIEDARSYK